MNRWFAKPIGFAVVAVFLSGLFPSAAAEELPTGDSTTLTISSVCPGANPPGVAERYGKNDQELVIDLDRVGESVTEVLLAKRDSTGNPTALDCANRWGQSKKIESIAFIGNSAGRIKTLTVGAEAFEEKTGVLNVGLTKVSFPAVETLRILNNSFAQVSNGGDCALEEVAFAPGVTNLEIGRSAFSQSDGRVGTAGVATPLKKVNFPAGLVTLDIGDYAFAQTPGGHSTSLKEVTFPDGLEELRIGTKGFYQEADGWREGTQRDYSLTSPETSLKEIVFPNSLKVLEIGNRGFAQSAASLGTNTRLQRVVIPGGMDELVIGSQAFEMTEFGNNTKSDFEYLLFATDQQPAEKIWIGSKLFSSTTQKNSVIAWLGPDNVEMSDVWTLDQGGSNQAPSSSYRLKGGRAVTFDANGGWHYEGNFEKVPTVFPPRFVVNDGDRISAPDEAIFYAPGGYKYPVTGWCDSDPGSWETSNKMECRTILYRSGESFSPKPGVTTLYAYWEGDPKIVNYDGNGADNGTMDRVMVEEGRTHTVISNQYQKRFYVFESWNSKPDGTGQRYSPKQEIQLWDEEVTLYAQWQGQASFVRYDSNGGDGVTDPSWAGTGDTVTVKDSNFTRAKYRFTGWNLAADGSRKNYQPGDPLTLPPIGLSLYAMWQGDPVSITYDKNSAEASGTMAPQPGMYGENAMVAASGFDHDAGYRFDSWTTEPDGGEVYFPGDLVLLEGDLNLYAQWVDASLTTAYDITYHSNYEPEEARVQPDVLKSRFARLSPNGFEAPLDHVFVGWSRDPHASVAEFANEAIVFDLTSEDSGGDPSATNVDLYAIWRPVVEVSYVIEFEANSGHGEMDPQRILAGIPTALSPNEFTREGYSVAGWGTAPDGGELRLDDGQIVTDLVPATQSLTLYSQWIAEPSLITYLGNGATSGTTETTTGVTDQVVQVANNSFERTGYTFVQWNTQPDGSGDTYQSSEDFTLVPGGSVLYAQWLGDRSRITYDKNFPDATGETEPTDGRWGDAVTAADNGFVPDEDWYFMYWAADHLGEEKAVFPGDKVLLQGDVTLYAQWSDSPIVGTTYDVVFFPNNGSGGSHRQSGVLRSQFSDLDLNQFPANADEVFLGWSKSPDAVDAEFTDGQRVFDLTSPDMGGDPSVGEVQLYGVWKPLAELSYTVKFDANGGAGSMASQLLPVGETAPLAANSFSFDGHAFAGWNTDKAGAGMAYVDGQQVDDIAEPGQVVTLYAQWKPVAVPPDDIDPPSPDQIADTGANNFAVLLILGGAMALVGGWLTVRRSASPR